MQNDTSRDVISLIERFNALHGTAVAAYTFDAGPNPVLFTLESHADALRDLISYCFCNGALPSDHIAVKALEVEQGGGILEIIEARVGDGPKIL